MNDEIDPAIQADMQLASDLVNLCRWPEYGVIDQMKKSFRRVPEDDMNLFKNELFLLLYVAVFSVIDGLKEKFVEKYQDDPKPEYSLLVAKLTFIRGFFQMGWNHVAEQKGIVNSDNKIADRLMKYSEALKKIAISTTNMNKLMTPFLIVVCKLLIIQNIIHLFFHFHSLSQIFLIKQ